MNRRLFLSTLLLPAALRADPECRPGFAFQHARMDLSRMSAPLGAGRITVELTDAVLTSEGGRCAVGGLDFVSLRANGVPAFAGSQPGRWELDADSGPLALSDRPLELVVYRQELDDSATIRRFAGTPPGKLSLTGVIRFTAGAAGATPQEMFVEFQTQGAVEVGGTDGMAHVLAEAALAELEDHVAEARVWREMLWTRIAPRIALLADASGKPSGLGTLAAERTLWAAPASAFANAASSFANPGPAKTAWLRGERPRDAEWQADQALEVRPRSESLLDCYAAAASLEPLARAEVAAEGFTEAAVFRAFRSPQGQAWLETRFLRARHRQGRLELFPEVDEHSFGSPLVLRDGLAGVVTGYSAALPAAAIASGIATAPARRSPA